MQVVLFAGGGVEALLLDMVSLEIGQLLKVSYRDCSPGRITDISNIEKPIFWQTTKLHDLGFLFLPTVLYLQKKIGEVETLTSFVYI